MHPDDYYPTSKRLTMLRDQGIENYQDLLHRFIHYIWNFKATDETYDIDQFNISHSSKGIKIGSHTFVAFGATLSSQNISEVRQPDEPECYLSFYILEPIDPSQTFAQVINRFNAIITMDCAQYIALYARLDHNQDHEINYSTHNFVASLVTSEHFPTNGYKRFLDIISASNMDARFIKESSKANSNLTFKISRTQYSKNEVILMNTIATHRLPFVENSGSYQVLVFTQIDGTYISFISSDATVNETINRIVKSPGSTVEPWRYANSKLINSCRIAQLRGETPPSLNAADMATPTNLLDVMAFMKIIAVPTELVQMLNSHSSQTTSLDRKTLIQILFHYYFMVNMEKSLPRLPRSRDRSYNLTWVTQGIGSSTSPDWRPLKSPQQLLSKVQEYFFGIALPVVGLRHYHEVRGAPTTTPPLGLAIDYPYTVSEFLIKKCPELLVTWLPEALASAIQKHSLKLTGGRSKDEVKQVHKDNANSLMILIGIAVWLSQLDFPIDVCYSLLVKYLTSFATINHLAVSLNIFGANVFDYAAATGAISRAYYANGRQWSYEQKEALDPNFIKLIFCMQPLTKSDWLLAIDPNKAIPKESNTILLNTLQFLNAGRSGDKRPILKAGRGCKEFLETCFNSVRSATGATHTAQVARADR